MIDSVPSIAPFSPPETGASSMRTPFSARAAPTFWDTIGEMVDMSITVWPERTPPSSPRAPRATSSTSGELGSIRMTIGASRATASGESAVLAPSPASSCTAPWLRLWTTRE